MEHNKMEEGCETGKVRDNDSKHETSLNGAAKLP